MEASEVPYANEGLPTFTCFSRLPLELREMIWERRISVQRHLRIEGRWGKPATIGSFSISEGMNLSRVCSESRKVLSRIIAYQTAEDGDGASIKRQFSIVLLTIFDTPSLEILASLKNDIYCIAIPRLAVGQLKKLHLSLKKRVAAGSRQIKVIYTGTRPYLHDQWQCRPPGNYLVKPRADFYVMADDAVSSLDRDKSFTVGTTEEEKEFRFLNSPFWSAYQSPKELCSTWMRLTSKDGVPAPVIMPSLITIPRS